MSYGDYYRSVVKARKDGKGIERVKEIEDEKKAKLTLEVDNDGRKVTSAKELRVGVI